VTEPREDLLRAEFDAGALVREQVKPSARLAITISAVIGIGKRSTVNSANATAVSTRTAIACA